MKKLVRSKLAWPGLVEIMADTKQEETRCPKSGGGKEARKNEIAIGDCIQGDTERIRKEWRNRWEELKTADRERSESKVRGRKRTMETETMVNYP